MNKNLFALAPAIFMALPYLVPPAYSAPAVRSVDVTSFDVGGVKTGMSVEEARAAMQKNFGVSADKIRASKSMKSQYATLIYGSPQIQDLVYENNGTRMQVSFEPRVPLNQSNSMAASLITYEIPWTKENETAMKEAAIAKYGPISSGGMNPIWCKKPLPTSGMGCEPDTAQLTVGSTTVRLFDPAWQNATSKYMDQQKATKPQF
ncbi:hypothetical protein BSK71_12435 [Pectobacterium actinidiae]|uniref:Uncharacterized protein n=1 Tax=Pectobacterium actinidiae TaxID=1507808 RepID=A0A1V2R2E3_9GAMM|nr:hypothetical protein [Pectobacterium actinidiae]QDX97476.1 hypothetical protein EGD00_10865 [Pectobacterium carotovorum subsp. carotovorum]MDY4313667.1 hypothetical protein [Pectobacterium actinidiae]ONK03504.1 hypothetical protein BSK69_12490 [Pectobacterium actinidiae]ONK05233.1 hypothetical protein BSK71_12435 [Pectobacterium actinidiae]WEF10169.1 hypothetical protein M9782_13160 [Pectobacterium actinidiae]